MTVCFLWDDRPGRNRDHIAAHGMTSDLWEQVYYHATHRISDKDDPTLMTAEGRVRKCLYRIVYAIYHDVVVPITILPITGFPIERRGLR